jgi:ribose transport system ATP-binding protein
VTLVKRLAMCMNPTATDPILRFEGLEKLYPPSTRALDGFHLELRRTEVHGLAGVNGAGKTTVIKVLSGIERATAGSTWLEGRRIDVGSPLEATQLGIGVVHQELPLLPNLTAADNVFLGTEASSGLARLRRRERERRYEGVAARFPTAPPASTRLQDVGIHAWQVVAIIRALEAGARLLVLDEPTSSLNLDERAALHGLLRELAAGGTPVIYVSHFLDDVLDVCDRVTVIRDGRTVACEPSADLTEEQLLVHMLGASEAARAEHRTEVSMEAAEEPSDREGGLVIEGVLTDGAGPVSFGAGRGECVGLYGLQGSGARELLEAIYGLRRYRGRVRWGGRELRGTVDRRVRRGVGYVSGDRKKTLIGDWSVAMNHAMPELSQRPLLAPVRRGLDRKAAKATIGRLEIRGATDDALRTLSGGNQQKLALGRWLTREGACLLADEPTLGVDAHGRGAIHELLLAQAGRGTTVLVHSSDPEELVSICGRVLAMASGRVVRELAGARLTVAALEAATRSTERTTVRGETER